MEPAEVVLLVLLGWQPPLDEREALLAACSRAFAPGVCLQAEPDAEVDGAWTAQVERTTAGEVTLRVRGEAETLERRLAFLPADTEFERAKAVGLTLGVLAGELARERASEREPARGRSEVSVATEPEAPASAPSSSSAAVGRVSLQVGVGRSAGGSGADGGGALRAGWGIPGSMVWAGLSLDGWWGGVTEHLAMHRSHALLWAALHQMAGPVELGVGVGAGVQLLRVRTQAPLPPADDGRLVPVLRAHGDVTYWLTGSWGLVATLQVGWATSPTDVLVRDEVVARLGHLHLGAVLGPTLRWGDGSSGAAQGAWQR